MSSQEKPSTFASTDSPGQRKAMLETELRQQILRGELANGVILAPIRELAARHNIAYGSVRKVLAQLEQDGLVSRRHGSGTVVSFDATNRQKASSLKHVALLINARTHVYGELLTALTQQLQEVGVTVETISHDHTRGVEQFAPVFRRWRDAPPQAVVCQRATDGLDEQLTDICGPACRYIAVYRDPSFLSQWHSVRTDISSLAEQAVTYALKNGHRRIGIVANRRHIGEGHWAGNVRKRTTGPTPLIVEIGQRLRAALGRGSMTVYYYSGSQPRGSAQTPFGELTLESYDEWMTQSDRPTLLIGTDYLLSAGTYLAKKRGIQIGDGHELQMLGIGNTPWAHSYGFDSFDLQPNAAAQSIMKLLNLTNDPSDISTFHLNIKPILSTHPSSDVGFSSTQNNDELVTGGLV